VEHALHRRAGILGPRRDIRRSRGSNNQSIARNAEKHTYGNEQQPLYPPPQAGEGRGGALIDRQRRQNRLISHAIHNYIPPFERRRSFSSKLVKSPRAVRSRILGNKDAQLLLYWQVKVYLKYSVGDLTIILSALIENGSKLVDIHKRFESDQRGIIFHE
jgi:hypothetical protein